MTTAATPPDIAQTLREAERRGYILPDGIFEADPLDQIDLLLRTILRQGAVPCPDTGDLRRMAELRT